MMKMSQSEREKLDSYCKKLNCMKFKFSMACLRIIFFLVHSWYDCESYLIVIGCEQANLSFAIFSVT